jgi:hypothetical protein
VKIFSAVLVAITLFAAPPASAEALNLSEVKCKDFLDGGREKMSLILMWLAGFYTDEDDPPIVDFDKMKAYTEKLSTFCMQNPTFGLMTAAEEIMK